MSMNSKLTIEYVALEHLQPYNKNPRTISPEGIKKLENSINRFGFVNPVLAQKGTGMIIAGHQRFKAAKEQGLKELPVIWLNMTAAEAQAYNLADNRLQDESDWECDLLADIFKELDDMDFDLSLTGFDDDEIGELIGVSAGEVIEDEVPEVPEEPKSKLGQIYALGSHRLMCGDSTSKADVATLMQGTQAGMMFTDPPWNVAIGKDSNPRHRQREGLLNDDMSEKEFSAFLSNFIAACGEHIKGDIYCVLGASEWPRLDSVLRAQGYHWSATIIWVKDAFVLGRSKYHRRYEPIWYGWRDKSSFGQRRDLDDVWEVARPRRSDEHPTMKPVELVARCIENSSRIGDPVLDPFGGSGTTLIAAEQLGRACYMMELDPRYVDVIISRWENHTGCKAELLGGEME